MIKMIHKFFLILIVECRICYRQDDGIPICGSDGKTYDNQCKMEFVACESNSEITMKYGGNCRDDYESSSVTTTYKKSI